LLLFIVIVADVMDIPVCCGLF